MFFATLATVRYEERLDNFNKALSVEKAVKRISLVSRYVVCCVF